MYELHFALEQDYKAHYRVDTAPSLITINTCKENSSKSNMFSKCKKKHWLRDLLTKNGNVVLEILTVGKKHHKIKRLEFQIWMELGLVCRLNFECEVH